MSSSTVEITGTSLASAPTTVALVAQKVAELLSILEQATKLSKKWNLQWPDSAQTEKLSYEETMSNVLYGTLMTIQNLAAALGSIYWPTNGSGGK